MTAHFTPRWRPAPRRVITGLTAVAAALAFVSPSTPVLAAGPRAAAASATPAATGTTASGYWMVGSDGKVYPFGAAGDLGSPALPAGARATHIEPTPDGGGYYVLDDRGDVFAFGHAAALGNAALAAGETAVSLSSTPSGQGYWIFTSAGRAITKGDARNLGDMSGKHLNAPVVSSTVTPDGSGYWMVAGDGGVFSFGAPFWGSTGNLKLNKPVEGIVPTATDKGYWLVASDGGVFAFGDAGFKGSMGSTKLNKPVVGLVRYGDGYLMVASDGGIFDFSNLAFQGSLGDHPPANPIVGTAALPAAPASVGVPAPTPPAPGGTTPTTTPPLNLPPGAFPANFSSTALTTYGSALDPTNTYGSAGTLEYAQMVESVVEIGDKVYVAGDFTNMVDPSNGLAPASPALPYLAVLDKSTGKPDPTSPFNTAAIQPDDIVMSLAASPDGRTLYVGGHFTHIGGGTSPKIAALDAATGQLLPGWSSPVPNAAVNAVALSADGTHLYIGGSFAQLGATPATYLAELDAATGNPIPAFGSLTDYGGYFSGHGGARVEPPQTVHASVRSLDLSRDGSTLLAGGDFLHFGVQADPTKSHAGLIAVNATSGQMTTWQPINSRPVFQITNGVVDQTTFYTAAGGAGGNVQEFHIGVGTGAPKWKVEVDGDGTGVAATNTEVFLVGHFGHVANSASDTCPVPTSPTQPVTCNWSSNPNRFNHLAAFDLTGKLLRNFSAQANTPKGPQFAYLGAQDLYVGGDFSGVASAPSADPTVVNSYRKQPGLAVFPACPSAAPC